MTLKVKQLELPNVTIEVRNGKNPWTNATQLPTQGRVRIKGGKRPPEKK